MYMWENIWDIKQANTIINIYYSSIAYKHIYEYSYVKSNTNSIDAVPCPINNTWNKIIVYDDYRSF